MARQPTTSTDLIRCFAPAAEPLPRALCLPHAGGSASFFFPLSRLLAADVEVLAVQYPGRQDRRHERPIEDLGTLAGQVAAAATVLDDRPLVVVGHSMGATLGYEVVRRLERAGRDVAHLIVSGRRAPSCPPEGRRLHTWPDDDLVAEMRSLAGAELPLPDDEMLRLALPAVRADYRAVETYVHDGGPPVRCPIAAVYGTADPRVTPDTVRRWGAHTTGEFRTITFPGGHFYLTGRMAETAALVRTAVSFRDTPLDTGRYRGGA